MNKIKIEIGFGVGEDKDRKPLMAVAEKLNRIEGYTAANFGGYTFVSTTGSWKDSKTGAYIVEAGLILLIITDDTENDRLNARLLAGFVRDVMHQACVTLTITPVHFEYI